MHKTKAFQPKISTIYFTFFFFLFFSFLVSTSDLTKVLNTLSETRFKLP